MNTFFIADLHFGDQFISLNRGYNNAAEMSSDLISRWNSVVQNEDIVYILGDFHVEDMPLGEVSEYARQINGQKFLIMGNHDIYSVTDYISAGFARVYDSPIIIDQFIILSHAPVYVDLRMPYINIFGHVHGNMNYRESSACGACVSAEKISFTPILTKMLINDIIFKRGIALRESQRD